MLGQCVKYVWASLAAQMVNNPLAMEETLGWEDPLEKGMSTHSSILAGEFQGQRNLAGYSPQGHKEQLTFFTFGYIHIFIHK